MSWAEHHATGLHHPPYFHPDIVNLAFLCMHVVRHTHVPLCLSSITLYARVAITTILSNEVQICKQLTLDALAVPSAMHYSVCNASAFWSCKHCYAHPRASSRRNFLVRGDFMLSRCRNVEYHRTAPLPTGDVLGSKITRTWMALNAYLGQYFDAFKGKTRYCIEVLAPFRKTVQATGGLMSTWA